MVLSTERTNNVQDYDDDYKSQDRSFDEMECSINSLNLSKQLKSIQERKVIKTSIIVHQVNRIKVTNALRSSIFE